MRSMRLFPPVVRPRTLSGLDSAPSARTAPSLPTDLKPPATCEPSKKSPDCWIQNQPRPKVPPDPRRSPCTAAV